VQSNTDASKTASDTTKIRRRVWKLIIVLTLCVGYAGYYVCRTNLSVSSPALIEEIGISKSTLGITLTAGTAGYAVGKTMAGPVIDVLGGRQVFLAAMVLSIICTILFPLGSKIWYLTIVWTANRVVQAAGWPAAVKVTSRWFFSDEFGKAMGFISLSFLFGDAVARFYLGWALNIVEDNWRALFWISALTLIVISCVSFFTLKSSPAEVGLPEPLGDAHSPLPQQDVVDTPTVEDMNINDSDTPEVLIEERNPQDSIRRFLRKFTSKNNAIASSLKETILPLVRRPNFWLLCLMSVGMTMLRSTFTDWTIVFLNEVAGTSSQNSALGSILFPLSGGFSCLLVGWLNDRLSKFWRGVMLVSFLSVLAVTLFGFYFLNLGNNLALALIFVTLVGFTLTGPYTLPAGALSLTIGGKRLCATTSGLVDTAGYLGGLLSGYFVGYIADNLGWNALWGILGLVTLATMIVTALFSFLDICGGESDDDFELRDMKNN
jgi:OPA family glycerol-3-phosphate transporter-like MFS transporter